MHSNNTVSKTGSKTLVVVILSAWLVLSAAVGVMGQGPGDGLPEPAEELQDLAFLVGDWDVSGQVLVAEDEWAAVEAVAVIDWHLEGHALREYMDGVAGDQVFAATTFRAFSPPVNRWEMVWADSLSEPLVALAGQAQGETFSFISRGAGESWEIYLTDIAEDSFALEILKAPGIGYTPESAWQLTYTRRTDPVTPDVIADLTAGAEMVAPPEQMDQFAFWIGEWEMDSLVPDGDEWVPLPAQDTLTWVINGFAMEEHWRGEVGTGPIVAYSLSRYNPSFDGWDNVWFGTGGRRLQTFRGGCEEDLQRCKLAGYFYDVYDGVEEFRWAIPDIDNPNWMIDFRRVEAE
ncbi:MAG: hypothetical protein GYB65_00260 [Chloroflexi bacterium]|nr:hypothetical protein [Chloroflexota bacterium]